MEKGTRGKLFKLYTILRRKKCKGERTTALTIWKTTVESAKWRKRQLKFLCEQRLKETGDDS
jgi:hypothetical protein